ncbi:MAG: response regulator, partial [Ignavibacteriaceae bacterium]|nr:response regulator [Ignavibacteriaceae bacterium]
MLPAVKYYTLYFIVLFIAVLLFNISLPAQSKHKTKNWPEPVFEPLTVADGLPENSVRCILQDHLGYMWFGTQNGLVKYDGYSMKVYQPDPDNSLSISYRQIHTIYEDNSGNLWIGTQHGLNRFDRVTETFKSYLHNPHNTTSISSNFVLTINEDKEGKLIIGTDKSLDLFNRQTGSFKRIYAEDSIYVRALLEDTLTGNLYVGIKNKIMIFDPEKVILKKNDDFKMNSELGYINSFVQSDDGSIWIRHTKGLSKFNPVQNSIQLHHFDFSDSDNIEYNFPQLIEDSNGFIWSGLGNNCLISFDPKNEQFKKFKLTPNEELTLSTVSSIYQDHSEIIWVGTFWRGLYKWDRKKQKFNRLSFDPIKPADGKFNRVNSIIEDSEGIIWFGTDNGLSSYHREAGIFRNYQYNIRGKSNTVTDIYKDELGILWLGTLTKGLVKMDPASNTYSFYTNDQNDSTSISDDYVRFILPDKNEVLWIGTWAGGLNKFDKKTGIFTRYIPDKNNPRSLSNQKVSSIFRDRNGTLWIGTDGPKGLNRYDKAKDSFTAFGYLDRINSVNVNTIYEDNNGNFWVGSYANGIYLFDRNSEEFVYNINQRDGLTHNTVRSIIEDDSGNLWISTNNGLSRFNSQIRTIKNYFTSEIFEENYYLKNSACKTSTGAMLFGTYDGFIMFHPDSIKDDPVPPQVVISNVSLLNRPDEKLEYDGFISELKELNLSYNENDLRFDFVGLHFGEPEKNQYKYMLENFDNEWIDAGTQRNATYTNLDAGEYVFRITACNRDGVWNEEGASLNIIIPPPFWATWWAYSFYVLFVLGVLYNIRKYELSRTHLKNQHKLDEVKLKESEETDRMKSRFFANISHEFRTPLTLILGPVEKILARSDDEIQKQANFVKRNATRLLVLINQLLDLSKLEAGKLELKASKNNIVSFIKGITMSFESVAERKDITLKVIAAREQIELYFDKDKMTKVMMNLLMNAFKFTKDGGQITVIINENDDNSVRINVSDTGQGIAKEELPKLFDRFYQVDSSQTREHEGTGIGLALTKELVELHKGSISVDSKFGEWTEFTIELPTGRRHLKDEEIVEAEEPIKEEILLEKEEIVTSTVEEVEENRISDEDKNILLVVEDNTEVREYIKESLKDDFQIEEASNGEQGVRKAERIIPDLIVSDVMMPKMDGNELTRNLKNDEKTSHIPIILLTAKSEQT